MKTIVIFCELSNRTEDTTFVYLENLARTGWNQILCSKCLGFKFRNDELMMNK